MTEQREKYEVAIRDDVLAPTWERMREQAKVLHDSGFFPKVIKGPAQALAIMLAGRELGRGPMESLRSIYIVNGATTISSGLMASMIWEAGHAYNIDKSTDTECQITFTRSNGQTYTHSFTIEDAKKAKLTGKDVWQGYAKAMLFNRCISAGARAFMPDVTRRMYTPEEMGAAVLVSESGDVVIDAEATDVTPAAWTTKQDWGKFWAYWKGDKGLTEDDIHKAIEKDSVKEFTGTKEEFIAKVEAYIEAQIKAQSEDEDAPLDESSKTPEQHFDDAFGNVEGRDA